MKKYFKTLEQKAKAAAISKKDIAAFYDDVLDELKKSGALQEGIELVRPAMIRNAIKNGANPSDVAWAICQ